MMRRVWLVRHGNTFEAGMPPRRIGARTDLALTMEGVAQADRLGATFVAMGVRFDRAYTGPLQRTRATAAAILRSRATTIEVLPILDEIDHGPDENAPEAAVRARLGEPALERWDRNGEAPCEWIVDAPGRLAGWSRFLADQEAAGAGDTLCVSSNGALRFALIALARAGAIELPARLPIRTGAFGCIALRQNGPAGVTAWDVRPG